MLVVSGVYYFLFLYGFVGIWTGILFNFAGLAIYLVQTGLCLCRILIAESIAASMDIYRPKNKVWVITEFHKKLYHNY